MKKKTLALLLSLVLVFGVIAGGTLAWLTAKSDVVTNTFTKSDISIELKETKSDFKMVPGWTIDKDPQVTVKAGSEDCWLFVKLDKSANFNNFMTYSMATGWEPVEGETNVYDRKVKSTDTVKTFSVLANDKVSVKDTVTKEMMTAEDYVNPTLTVSAYACQLYSTNGVEFSVTDAWAKASAN